MALVKYLAVGRLAKGKDGNFIEDEHQIIASASHDKDDPAAKGYKNHVKQIMTKGAQKLKPNKRIRLTSEPDEYDMHVTADLLENKEDQIIVFFAVTTVSFGQTHNIAKLFEEFKTQLYQTNDAASIMSAKSNGTVHKNCQTFMASLIKKYGSNKLAEVQARVEEVKTVMRDNVDKTLENVEKLEDLEQKSETIENSARQFDKNAGGLKSSMRWRYIKLTIIIALVIIAVLLAIILPIALRISGQ